jgi:hypothetical protein
MIIVCYLLRIYQGILTAPRTYLRGREFPVDNPYCYLTELYFQNFYFFFSFLKIKKKNHITSEINDSSDPKAENPLYQDVDSI